MAHLVLPMNLAADEKVIFLHIPRTGGTTLHSILSGYFNEREICPERFNHLDRWNSCDLSKYRLFSGHYDYNQVGLIPGRKKLITILREPKARILSLYYFWSAHKWQHIEKHNLGGPRIAKSVDLLSFLRYRADGMPSNIDNVFVRRLIGPIYVGPKGEYLYPGDEALEIAKRRLREMTVFGILEHFQESISRIAAALQFPAPENIQRLRSFEGFASTPDMEAIEREPMTPEILGVLEKLTALDRQLYNYALRLFRERDG